MGGGWGVIENVTIIKVSVSKIQFLLCEVCVFPTSQKQYLCVIYVWKLSAFSVSTFFCLKTTLNTSYRSIKTVTLMYVLSNTETSSWHLHELCIFVQVFIVVLPYLYIYSGRLLLGISQAWPLYIMLYNNQNCLSVSYWQTHTEVVILPSGKALYIYPTVGYIRHQSFPYAHYYVTG